MTQITGRDGRPLETGDRVRGFRVFDGGIHAEKQFTGRIRKIAGPPAMSALIRADDGDEFWVFLAWRDDGLVARRETAYGDEWLEAEGER